MKLKLFTIACILFGLIGCSGGTLKEVVEEKHPDGSNKKVSFKKGAKTVHTIFYFPNGKVQSESFFNDEGKPDSVMTIYYISGEKYKETHYSDGMRNGSDKAWYEDGKVKMEAEYASDMPQGTVVSYFANGNKASETPYKDGKKDGPSITYDSTGQKVHLMTYAAGNPSGIEQKWYPNGNLKEENTWKDNVLNGPFTMYHENGKKMEEGTYLDGKYHGKRLAYNEKGRKIADTEYKNGELIDGTAF